jgi:hypothetical protein
VNKRRSLFRVFIFLLSLTLCSSLAHAQLSRTWVSGVGDDANPCSRTAPCKTLAGAIGKTAAGGEIDVMDPGAFGALLITKSITIQNEGFLAGVQGPSTNGIIVNAGANDVVVIRGLTIEGLGTGLNGIRFLAGGALHIENCTINGFRSASAGSGHGIDFEPSGASELYVKNTVVRNNGTGANGGGILIKPTVSGSAKASLDNVQMENNVFGIKAQDNSTVTVRNSTSSGNSFAGASAISVSGGAVNLTLDHVASVNNGTHGVQSSGATATVRITNVTTTGNANGLTAQSSGAIVSFGSNNNHGNTTADGAPTSVPGQQ